jgi:hypothetical protein
LYLRVVRPRVGGNFCSGVVLTLRCRLRVELLCSPVLLVQSFSSNDGPVLSVLEAWNRKATYAKITPSMALERTTERPCEAMDTTCFVFVISLFQTLVKFQLLLRSATLPHVRSSWIRCFISAAALISFPLIVMIVFLSS